MSAKKRRSRRTFRPRLEPCESRQLLSGFGDLTHPIEPPVHRPLYKPGFMHPIRPNTPVLPYGAISSRATFIDPSVRVLDGRRIMIGSQSFLAPYGTVDGRLGMMMIGRLSTIQDNATIVANPNSQPGNPMLTIGDLVAIDSGALVRGPGTLGAFEKEAATTYVGPNATIDGANLDPGAFVSALAYVGPGVTVPAGWKVLPGVQVTTQAEASDLTLGKVVPVTPDDLSAAESLLASGVRLAAGYSALYQNNIETGPSPGTPNPTVFNGDLSRVLGVGPEPARPSEGLEPPLTSPRFPSPRGLVVPYDLPWFRGRVTGDVRFAQRAASLAQRFGRSDSIRGDAGQPILIVSIARLGNSVSIHAPEGGQLSIGQNFRAEDRAVILGGPHAEIGDDVVVGSGAVLENASIGAGSSIGANSYLKDVTIPPGSVIAPGTILVESEGLRRRLHF